MSERLPTPALSRCDCASSGGILAQRLRGTSGERAELTRGKKNWSSVPFYRRSMGPGDAGAPCTAMAPKLQGSKPARPAFGHQAREQCPAVGERRDDGTSKSQLAASGISGAKQKLQHEPARDFPALRNKSKPRTGITGVDAADSSTVARLAPDSASF